MRTRTVLAALAAATLAATGTANANGQQRHACSPFVAIDSFSDALDKTTYEGTYVGNLSALAVDRDGKLAALSDRSTLFRLDAKGPTGAVTLPGGLDSEGLAVDRDGTRLISSETEPSVRRYSREGKLLEQLPVPSALKVTPAGRATPNQTFEGLTLLPGGHTLLASMEYALAGDTPGTVRFQTWTRDHGRFRLGAQYAYRTDDPGLGVPEVQAMPDGRLLVLERGFEAGVGNTVRLSLADPRHATDTSRVEHLTGQPGVRPMGKTPLADLADCPTLGATARQPQPNPLLDNIEGMTVTGGAHTLKVLLVSDDNQNPAQTTRLYRLRVRLS
ncbi:esterase-like activity of phytase family protein [Streptomyces sp. SID4982]|uniref:esterase-like activity of phytase family protein n=1 Tax=Streptomyces sp. SID4982 TaxID=2690291 RepID=UPI001371731B|nr:esterase-like activity of phytase family protein [Streptomyces sp. SID4982]MYS17415.1 esterase-like activity of phytase family protein [Streptomyces sp. SID4982]